MTGKGTRVLQPGKLPNFGSRLICRYPGELQKPPDAASRTGDPRNCGIKSSTHASSSAMESRNCVRIARWCNRKRRKFAIRARNELPLREGEENRLRENFPAIVSCRFHRESTLRAWYLIEFADLCTVEGELDDT